MAKENLGVILFIYKKISPAIIFTGGFYVICGTFSNFSTEGDVAISLVLYCSHS